jgi:hypothetical protein
VEGAAEECCIDGFVNEFNHCDGLNLINRFTEIVGIQKWTSISNISKEDLGGYQAICRANGKNSYDVS